MIARGWTPTVFKSVLRSARSPELRDPTQISHGWIASTLNIQHGAFLWVIRTAVAGEFWLDLLVREWSYATRIISSSCQLSSPAKIFSTSSQGWVGGYGKQNEARALRHEHSGVSSQTANQQLFRAGEMQDGTWLVHYRCTAYVQKPADPLVSCTRLFLRK